MVQALAPGDLSEQQLAAEVFVDVVHDGGEALSALADGQPRLPRQGRGGKARDPAAPGLRRSTQNSRIRSPGALPDSCARGTDTWQRAGAPSPRRRSRGAVRPLRHSAAPGGQKESRQRCAARSAPRGSPRPAPPCEIHAPRRVGCSSRPARAGGSPRRHSGSAASPRST